MITFVSEGKNVILCRTPVLYARQVRSRNISSQAHAKSHITETNVFQSSAQDKLYHWVRAQKN